MPLVLFLFLSLTILFYPALNTILPYSHMHLIRAEYAILLIVVIFFGGAKILYMIRLFKVEVFLIYLILFFSMFGMIYQSIWLGFVSSSDMMIVPRLTIYCLFLIFAGIVSFNLTKYKNDAWLLYTISCLLVVLTVAQYYNLFGINQIIRPFSLASEAVQRMALLVENAGWRRAVGTIGNPNYWGLVLVIFACVASYRLLWENRWIYAPLLAGLMGSLWLTGSRSALVGFVGALVIGGGLLLFTIKKTPSMVTVSAFALLAIMAIAGSGISGEVETSDRYSLDKLKTLELRVATWGRILDEMSRNPISFAVGQGTRKDTNVVGFADNAYVKILREHGLIGLIPYVCLLGYMIRRTLRLVKSIDEENRAWPGGLLLLLLAWAIFDLSADTWFSPRMMAIVLGLYAFVHMVGANRLGDKPIRAPATATDQARDLSHI